MKPTLTFKALAAGLTMIQYAGATDYQFGTVNAPFSTGFTPTLSSNSTTTADRLIFGGNNVTYTATDDLTGITVNAEVFNNTVPATPTQSVIVARGSGDNLITLGGSNPYISFANTVFGGVTENLDHTFATSGFITKLANQSAAASNPVLTGALNLGSTTLTVALQDTGGDALAELAISGAVTGTGLLVFDNGTAAAGVGAPGTGTAAFGTTLLSASNTGFTGSVMITRGRLIVNKDSGAGTGLITVGGALNSGGVLSLGGNNGNGGQNYGGLGVGVTGITLPNAINLGGETSGNYGQGLINNTGINTINGAVTLQQAQVNVQVNNASSLTLAGGVGESAAGDSLVKSGNGTLIVNNPTFTGPISAVNGGNLAFTGTAPTAGTLTVGAGGALQVGTVGNSYASLAAVLASGRIAPASSGVIAITGTNASADLTGFPTLGLGATPAGAEITGPITFAGTNLRLGGGGGTLTISQPNALTGAYSIQISTNPVVLNGANNFTGGVILTSSTLTLGAAGAIGTSGVITFNGGTLRYTAANTIDHSARFSTAANQQYNFDTNGQNVLFATGFVSAGGQIDKIGTGTLTLGSGGTTAFGTANLFVDGGTLVIANGATLTNTGFTSIARLNGQTGTLNVLGTGSLATTGDFNVSDLNATNGVLNHSSSGTISGGTTYVGKNGASTGVLNITGGGQYTQTGGGDTRIGGANNNVTDQPAVGIVNLTNGTFATPANFQIGAGGRGQFNQTGGTTTITGGFTSIGRYATSFGVYNLNGGAVNYVTGGTGSRFIVGETGIGILNVRAGTLTIGSTSTTSALTVGNDNVATSYGRVNLRGGTINTLSVGKFAAAATAIFNFNGGTLQARGANATFMQGLNNAYVYPGNAIVDSNGFNVTIAQPLLAPAGGGVASIAFTGGTGFTAAPIVQLTGGDGVGASAVATIDGSGNLTGFVITNPGTGYTVAPTVTLYNAALAPGGALPTGLGVTLATNASGGLVKNGTGTLTLSGANTYTGNTTVNGGVLSLTTAFLADSSSVVIGASGMLNLPHGLTDTVAALTVNGVVKGAGTYDATTDPLFITGTGKILVAGGGATGFDAFRANPANNLTAGVNDGPNDDPDGDGIPNLLEFVLGGLPNGAGASNTSILPTRTLTPTDLILTFRRADASEGDVTLKVQYSSDLVTFGPPKEVTVGATSSGIVAVSEDNPSPAFDTVTVTIPRAGNEANGKLFARVIVTRP